MDLTLITEVVTKYVPAALALLGAFSILAKVTPTKADDKIVDFLYKAIDFFGLTKKEVK